MDGNVARGCSCSLSLNSNLGKVGTGILPPELQVRGCYGRSRFSEFGNNLDAFFGEESEFMTYESVEIDREESFDCFVYVTGLQYSLRFTLNSGDYCRKCLINTVFLQ